MEQMYFIGIDVSKEKLDAVVVNNQNEVIIRKIIKNKESAIRTFVERIKRSLKVENKNILICCEHTGLYCAPLKMAATELQYSLWIENAYKISKASSELRGKSDQRDAARIAEYALRYCDRQILYKEPSQEIVQLQILLGARETLLEKLTALRQQVNECKTFDPERHKLLKSCFDKTMRTLSREIEQLDERIEKLVASNEKLANDARLLQSIPGVGTQVSLNFLGSTNGMINFESAKQLACYAGVVPFPNQSGTVTKRDRVSKFANKKLKKLLHLAAMAAVNTQGELRAYYIRKVKQGKNKMAVLNAIRNKLVHRMVAVITRQSPYVTLMH